MNTKISLATFIVFVLPVTISLYLLEMYYALAIFILFISLIMILFHKNIYFKVTGFDLILYISGGILVFFIILPIISIFRNPEDILVVMGRKSVQNAIIVSLSAGVMASAIALFTGLPIAYILVRKQFFAHSIVEGILDLPVAVPHVVAGIALLAVFGFNGPLATWDIIDTIWGTTIAMLFVSIPFMINHLKEGIRSVSVEYEHVAMSLGASKANTFTRIVIPMIKPNIISGFLMTLARGISEFGAVVIIAYYPRTAPVLIYDAFLNAGGLNASRPIAALFLIVVFLVFIILRIISHKPSTGV